MNYDLVVIGSGPSGQKGAIAAAKLGKKVAIIERRPSRIGGVCLHTGTIPSKTMREAILHLSGYRHRDVYGEQFRRKRHITMQDLKRKMAQVTQHEMEIIDAQFDRNGIDIFSGEARFVDPHSIEVIQEASRTVLTTDRVLLACGTKPDRPSDIKCDGRNVFDSDQLLELDTIPRSMAVIGGGVIGMEYAIMFATLGVRVTVVDGRERLLSFCDREIIDMLLFHARSLEMVLRLGEDVVGIDANRPGRVVVELKSGKRLVTESALMAVGRRGDTDGLNLEAAGLKPDARGRVKADVNYQTEVPHIYGVGDVVGMPALASVAMVQGRRAVAHAFKRPMPELGTIPYGLFTIPEIGMIGETEETLTAKQVSYEVGCAQYREIARGQIVGEQMGMLKLVFDRKTRKLLGAHCIGESATEIIHIAQAVMAFNGTIDYFRDTVFNYPTITECYKVAAFDGLNKLCIDEPDDSEESNEPNGLTAGYGVLNELDRLIETVETAV